jgi:pimeloyl-ACP methyl ester carboxylesterase
MKSICACCLLVFSFQFLFSQPSESFALINQSKIYYHKSGSKKAAVVFVSGLGEDHQTWQLVQDSIAKFATTLSYDRAGLGRSEFHGEKKDVSSMAEELHTLVHSIHFTTPFIMIGHSLGCQVVKEYTALYPYEVAGIIFLDPGYNENKLKAIISDSLWGERQKALKKYIPPFSVAQKAELENANESAAISDRISTLPRIHIVLFTATLINPGFPASREELVIKKETHLLWLKTFPWARHRIVKESRHYIQYDKPGVVIETAEDMIRNLRHPSKEK